MTPSDLLRTVTAMLDRANDLSPVLKAIGDLMVASVDRNFEAEGRPTWAPVRPATAKRKAKAGREKVLMWSGNLAKSITFTVGGNRVAVGTNVSYGRIHNLGGTIHREASERHLRFRLDAKGHYLSQQNLHIGPSQMRNASSMRVFAKSSHKRAIEKVFTAGAYDISMPARPFLMFQPGETEAYGGLVLNFILSGRIGG